MYIILMVLLAIAVLIVALKFKQVVASFGRTKAFFGEVSLEMRKVTWPTQEEVINSTILVVVTTLALTLMLWIVDFLLGHLVNLIY